MTDHFPDVRKMVPNDRQVNILTDELHNANADVKRFREAASCERDVRRVLEKQVGTLQAELRRLHEENAFLLDRLKDARELVADWGSYASDYFQDKHGLKTDLAMLDAAIQRAEKT